jgi:hypothetical protein
MACAVDLAARDTVADQLSRVGEVAHLVLAVIDRDQNAALEYSVARAIRLVTLKLVGSTEVVHSLATVPGSVARTKRLAVVEEGPLTAGRTVEIAEVSLGHTK